MKVLKKYEKSDNFMHFDMFMHFDIKNANFWLQNCPKSSKYNNLINLIKERDISYNVKSERFEKLHYNNILIVISIYVFCCNIFEKCAKNVAIFRIFMKIHLFF